MPNSSAISPVSFHAARYSLCACWTAAISSLSKNCTDSLNLQICHSTRSDVSKSDTDKCENLRKRFCQWYTFAQVKEAIDITPEFVATIPIPRLAPEKEKEIADRVREAEKMRDKANKDFIEQRNHIESIMFSNMKSK